jgi:hypothetical protein
MIVRDLRISVALGLLLAPCIASAQRLDNSQIISALGQVKGAALAIDVTLLVEEANANVGKGVAALPNWSKLSELSQLIVEIDFENNSTALERDRNRQAQSRAPPETRRRDQRGAGDHICGFTRSPVLGRCGRRMADRCRPPGVGRQPARPIDQSGTFEVAAPGPNWRTNSA